MHLLAVVVVLGVAALAAGQGVPLNTACMPQSMTEEKCLSHCSCAYCHPAETDSSMAETGAASADGRSHKPIVGCVDWVNRGVCAGNYTTTHGTCHNGDGLLGTIATVIIVVVLVLAALITMCRGVAECFDCINSKKRAPRGLPAYDDL